MVTVKNISILMAIVVLSLSSAMASKIEGVLVFDYGDSFDSNNFSFQNFYLQTDKDKIKLNASEAFRENIPIHAWTGKRVAVNFKGGIELNKEASIHSIELLEGESFRGGDITGPQKWVSFLCKFSDIADEPENEAFFDNMYANSPAGLDHYWREVSYNKANVVGSIAFDWVDLPLTQQSYIPDPGNGGDSSILNPLFDDCTEAALNAYGGSFDINDGFVGINMMFNGELNCCAWGGGRWTSLDGGSPRLWRVTWNPPWAFANEGVIAHEMGHGFGLPHSNNSDGDSNPYDSPWDVMSSATGYAVNDNVYGKLGKHINMNFKHRLGWVNDSEGFIADENTNNELVFINYSSLANLPNSGHRFARIPVSNGTHYVVEVRQANGNYEANIVDDAVIIHNVNNCRSEPPWVVDGDANPANYSDNEGSMWKVGETFVDPIDDFEVYVAAEFLLGFNVRITASDDLIKRQSFEAVCFE